MQSGPRVKIDANTPCGDCPHVKGCATSGMVCQAYNCYVINGYQNKKWRLLPREPSAEMTTHHQILHQNQVAKDLAWLAKLAKRQARRAVAA